MIEEHSLHDFYRELHLDAPGPSVAELGHFNIFSIAEVNERIGREKRMPYNRREYYKISLIRGRNRVEYADRVIDIQDRALLFATPKIPYHYVPVSGEQAGTFCVFSEDFLSGYRGLVVDQLALFRAGAYPVFTLTDEQFGEAEAILAKLKRDLRANYAYREDLLRTYLMELIHFGQRLQPTEPVPNPAPSAARRLAGLFAELLERQFPLGPHDELQLRSPGQYAARLSVHVNHLNRVLKQLTHYTTSQLIHRRILQEAKIMLRHSDVPVAEIAYRLGFRDPAHFTHFFKRYTAQPPVAFRR